MDVKGIGHVRYLPYLPIEACSLNFCDLLFGHGKDIPPASFTVEDFALQVPRYLLPMPQGGGLLTWIFIVPSPAICEFCPLV